MNIAALRLVPVSYVILGFVSQKGPITSYDIKQKVEHSVGYVWPFAHTQLYTEPKRLESLGLLEATSEADGRRRRLYSITEAGRNVLAAWLDDPAQVEMEIRDLGLIQLFFAASEEDDPDRVTARVRALAQAQRSAHQQRLAEYEDIGRAIAAGEMGDAMLDGGCCHRTLTIGLRMERLMIDFWTEVETDPPAHC
jgi:DNA-binding PadR family transcriptional regulator